MVRGACLGSELRYDEGRERTGVGYRRSIMAHRGKDDWQVLAQPSRHLGLMCGVGVC